MQQPDLNNKPKKSPPPPPPLPSAGNVPPPPVVIHAPAAPPPPPCRRWAMAVQQPAPGGCVNTSEEGVGETKKKQDAADNGLAGREKNLSNHALVSQRLLELGQRLKPEWQSKKSKAEQEAFDYALALRLEQSFTQPDDPSVVLAFKLQAEEEARAAAIKEESENDACIAAILAEEWPSI